MRIINTHNFFLTYFVYILLFEIQLIINKAKVSLNRSKSLIIVLLILYNTSFMYSKEIPPDSTKIILKTWMLSENYDVIDIEIDTFQNNFHIYNPIEQKSISNKYLGNMGHASVSNIYLDNNVSFESKFMFSRVFEQYLYTPKKIKYYKTSSPYTELYYTTSTNRRSEIQLGAKHTQNITEAFNAGIDYRILSSQGEFPKSKTRDARFSFFTNYKGYRYSVFGAITFNKFKLNENGGVDSINTATDYIATNLNDAKSIYYDRTVFLNHSLMFGKKVKIKINDTLSKKIIIPKVTINHTFSWKKNYRTYSDNEPDSGFYKHVHIDSSQSSDSSYFRIYENTVQLKFTPFKKYKISVNAGAINELIKTYYFKEYIRLNDDDYYSNTFAKFDLINNGKKWKFRASAKIGLQGHRQGDTYFNGSIQKIYDSLFISLNANYISKTSGIFETNYISNNYIWNNNFDRSNTMSLFFNIKLPYRYLNLKVAYKQLDKHIYFPTDSITQYQNSVNIISASLKKDFHFRKFHLINEIIFQKSSIDSVISIPMISVYHSAYFEHAFFKKVLNVRLGYQVYYTSDYFLSGYNPALGQFRQLNNEKTGNYPIINVFANASLKSALLFIKFEHVNAGMINDNYYMAYQYPMNSLSFKFGVSWRFFN